MSEKTDFNLFRKNMMQRKDRIDRVENICVDGMPDVSYCIDGVDGWIEIKSPKEPKRATSKLLRMKLNHKLLQSQKNWFLCQRMAGGKGYILICTDKRWMLIDGCKYADQVNDMTVNSLHRAASWVAFTPIKEEGWFLLRWHLKGADGDIQNKTI